MTDTFNGIPHTRNQPAPGLFVVTPDDNADLPHVIQYFRVGSTAGDVEVVSRNGDTVVIPSVQIGEVIVGEFMRIKAAGTTATGITGFYT